MMSAIVSLCCIFVILAIFISSIQEGYWGLVLLIFLVFGLFIYGACNHVL